MIKITIASTIVLIVCSNSETDKNFAKFKDNITETKLTFTNAGVKYSMLANVSPEELINYYNYKGEKHLVTTTDEYEITLHRITAGNQTNLNPEGKPVVLLQHGLFGSSMNWLITGPNRSLAFLLADIGFDVWLGNSRGFTYSQKHKTKYLNQSEYWDYSWHELGIYDLPAIIDYILIKTGKKKIFYIGHGQGATTSYVLLSERPEYNDKILALFSLAPISFLKHINPFIKILARLTVQKEFSSPNGYYKVNGFDEDLQNFVKIFCNKDAMIHDHCENVLSMFKGYSIEEYDPELYPIILEHYPSGLSVKQIIHYNQLMISGHFRQFDYGQVLNKKKYKTLKPLDYKIENIKVPTTLIFATKDLFTPMEDVVHLYNKLSNPNGLYRVNHETFNHIDFLWGKNVKHLVYDDVISFLLKYLNKDKN